MGFSQCLGAEPNSSPILVQCHISVPPENVMMFDTFLNTPVYIIIEIALNVINSSEKKV